MYIPSIRWQKIQSYTSTCRNCHIRVPYLGEGGRGGGQLTYSVANTVQDPNFQLSSDQTRNYVWVRRPEIRSASISCCIYPTEQNRTEQVLFVFQDWRYSCPCQIFYQRLGSRYEPKQIICNQGLESCSSLSTCSYTDWHLYRSVVDIYCRTSSVLHFYGFTKKKEKNPLVFFSALPQNLLLFQPNMLPSILLLPANTPTHKSYTPILVLLLLLILPVLSNLTAFEVRLVVGERGHSFSIGALAFFQEFPEHLGHLEANNGE